MILGIFKNKSQKAFKSDIEKILGEETASNVASSSFIDMNQLVQNTFQSSKEVAAEKASEVQKTIVKTVEKEVSNFTQAQVDSLKQQICRDWGIVSSSSAKTP